MLATTLEVSSQTAPKRDYVPIAETAIAIAEAVLVPVYGKKLIESERPYKAALNGETWHVSGTLHCAGGGSQTDMPPVCVGGVAIVDISEQDAHIISMTHYK
jgi:NTF2 fold immunity protein